MIDPWRPMREVPDAEACPVDLLVKAKNSIALFRVPDGYRYGDQWFSRAYHFPLSTAGWEPVAWMPVPPIPSVEEVRACRAAE